jgi:cysteine desulfurase
MKKIFLDHASTTPTDPRVVEAMLPYFSDSFGNPSSIHSLGLETRTAVAEAREKVAGLIGAAADEIIFTSGGTEADNLAIKGVAQANAQRGKHIVTTRIEHHAVEESCRYLEKQGFKVTHVGVDKDGLVDPREIEEAVTPETILISVMHANNEVGTIQPIAEISRVARSRGVYFHTDAVQTVGHIPTKVDELGVDLLAISAHKLYGPKGIGVL